MTAARFPLRPGKPLVFRRENGRWGWSCNCLRHGRLNAQWSERFNCDSHAHALRSALIHVQVCHKSPAELEVEALEHLYLMPAHERTAR